MDHEKEKTNTWQKCSTENTCYDLLRGSLAGPVPVELLGRRCGGSNGRCEGQCVDTNAQQNSYYTRLSSSPKVITKTIRPPNPSGLTFPNYLKSLAMAIETGGYDLPPDLMEPPSRPPHKWQRRYRIALWKGIACGATYVQVHLVLGWLLFGWA